MDRVRVAQVAAALGRGNEELEGLAGRHGDTPAAPLDRLRHRNRLRHLTGSDERRRGCECVRRGHSFMASFTTYHGFISVIRRPYGCRFHIHSQWFETKTHGPTACKHTERLVQTRSRNRPVSIRNQ